LRIYLACRMGRYTLILVLAYKAVHLPGGNFFDDVRLDLPASYVAQDEWLRTLPKVSARTSAPRTFVRRVAHRKEPYRLREALVNAGIARSWFEVFRDYWEHVIDGRPLTVMDFHNLRFNYRRRAQSFETLAWSDPETHLAHWQAPANLFQTFDSAYRAALHPMWGGNLLSDLLGRSFRVLEYGCGVAPMYRTWRRFLSATHSQWVLADIPGFSFHFTRHALGRDAEAELAVIEDFGNPLATVEGEFDLIIVQTVFEHLDSPRQAAERLLERLKPGGLFWFDYIRSAGTGLDTPAGLLERRATLEYLAEQLHVVHGKLQIDDNSLGTCVGRKRA
jgi:SAM-dependent methyltransferase